MGCRRRGGVRPLALHPPPTPLPPRRRLNAASFPIPLSGTRSRRRKTTDDAIGTFGAKFPLTDAAKYFVFPDPDQVGNGEIVVVAFVRHAARPTPPVMISAAPPP